MEKYINIPTSDGCEIKGVLNWKDTSDKLIIFVHGLTGNLGEAHYVCAKDYFLEKGYKVFRFNFYTDGVKTRKLKDCSVAIHSQDLKTVLQHFSKLEKDIYIVGHSLAGPCIAGTDNIPDNIRQIVFWDPAFEVVTAAKSCYEKNNSLYRSMNGKDIEIGIKMYNEFLQDPFLDVLNNQPFPKSNMSAIYASDGRHKNNKPMIDNMGIQGCIIEGANHGFTQEGKYDELFTKTLEYIKN